MVSTANARHAGSVDHVDRTELAAFLRRARARVRPADVGLAAGPRRRTPGLRRQEVAQLAGMSVDYYIRLEQGRGPRPSRQMIGAIGRALRLSGDEITYLHHLLGESPAPPAGPDRTVRPGLSHLLDRLDDTPALVCGADYDILAWNALAEALLVGIAELPVEDRNVALRFFTDPATRERYAPDDAAMFARECVADLRGAAARYPDDPRIKGLVKRLLASSAEFRTLWAEQDVNVARTNRKRLRHPVVGWLDLDCQALLDPLADQWVILYTAAPGTPSHEALKLLKVIGTQDLAPRH
jgi:transcriptional regulator with XRE-family HTH domain